MAEINPEFARSLSEALHFRYYLQAYLSGAFLTMNFPVEVLYYGQKLLFNLETEEKENLENLLKEMSLKKPEEDPVADNMDIPNLLPTVYKISSNCCFKIHWDFEDLR